MTKIGVISLFVLALLNGCSKPPDLEAPCHNFGKHCPQFPINNESINEVNA